MLGTLLLKTAKLSENGEAFRGALAEMGNFLERACEIFVPLRVGCWDESVAGFSKLVLPSCVSRARLRWVCSLGRVHGV